MPNLRVAFYTLGLPFSGATLYQKSLGGSETALLYMAREWAKLGHDVSVFCRCSSPGVYEGVRYHREEELQQMSTFLELDVFFCYRFYHQLAKKIKSHLNILVTHDVPVNGDEFASHMWGCDQVFVLSDYHKQLFKEIVPLLTPEMIWKTSNGVDLSMTDAFLNTPKQDIVVYGSRPERGLDVLLTKVWPRFLEKYPRFRLALAGYDLGDLQLDDNMKVYYRQLNDLVQNTPKVQDVGCLMKKDWYELLASSKLMLYPTSFPEIFCLNVLESQTLRTPVITTHAFAFTEVVRGGALIKGDPHTPAYIELFLKAADDLLESPERYDKAQRAGRQWAMQFQWKDLAKSWEQKCLGLLEERWERSKSKVVDNLVYHSDLIAAENLAEDDRREQIQTLIADVIENNRQGCYDEKEFQTLMEWELGDISKFQRIYELLFVTNLLPEKFRMLDMACHFGEFVTFLTNTIPTCRVVAVDHDKDCVKAARKLIKKKGKNGNHITLIHSSISEFQLREGEERFDIVFLGEILEHFPDPRFVLQRAETWLKPGGLIVATTPNGPYEGQPTKPPRHLHNFDTMDIKSLTDGMPDFNMTFVPLGTNPRGDLLGSYIWIFRPDGRPYGPIDYSRKRRVRPYQYVSACLITKNEENNIGRCLASIKPFVDEIVVADTGSTDETIKMAQKYTDNVFSIPFDIDGDGLGNFAAWRNEGLKGVSKACDWILWGDADEVLTEGHKIHKYLMGEFFQGFVIRQHHQILDLKEVAADLPMRIFRNNGRWKFWGVIHEQACDANDPNKEVSPGFVITDVDFLHYGYPTERLRRIKLNRNLPLLKKDRKLLPHREVGALLVIRDFLNFAIWAGEGYQLNQLPPKTLEYARAAVQMFYEEFWNDPEGRKRFWARKAFDIYQKTLELLGRGGVGVKPGDLPPLQIAFSLVGSIGGLRNDPASYGSRSFWFTNFDEMKAFLRDKGLDLEKVLTPISPFKIAGEKVK